MDKQKQIEEMAKDYYGYSIDLEEDCKFVATEMYDKGHRKIPENAVVLTREEYDELKQAKILLEFREETIKYLEEANIRYSEALENKSKETAEKILKPLYDACKDDSYGQVVVDFAILERLAKQFGVKIKE